MTTNEQVVQTTLDSLLSHHVIGWVCLLIVLSRVRACYVGGQYIYHLPGLKHELAGLGVEPQC